jgi:Ca-activated chloride channel family protein
MNIETNAETMRLASRDSEAPSPVLTGVTAEGRLDGVLFELSVRQTYRNTSDRLLEVVYTFPLPAQAVLLGFASELNGARQEGVVVAKHEAERQYEEALVEGDAPVMLEALADGLHTANIGNLKPGDEIVLEVRHAQLLAFDAGRLRVAIPTTIAPRYGDPASAGLQPQQVPEVSLHAEYPMSLAITVGAALANAAFDCPTHQFTRTSAEANAQRFELTRGAWLDRDVVIVVTPREPRPSLLVNAHDPVSASAPHVVMAAFQPPAGAGRERIALKLLVDCSGSMGGDSIASARRALRGVMDSLTERDSVSLSRFGSSVEHPLASAACDGAHREKLLRAVERIDADLGGTEMEMALRSVFALASGSDLDCTDVLLITDGEIWNIQPTIEAARRSGHRVFALGVGASPAEAVLRQLAEATGGACEFCTPGEGLEEAARRALRRIRQPAWRDLAVDWANAPNGSSCRPSRSRATR